MFKCEHHLNNESLDNRINNLANKLLYRDFINIVGKYNYLRTKNCLMFVSFVAHDFALINYYQIGSLLFSIIRKQYQFALATRIHYPAKPVSPIS